METEIKVNIVVYDVYGDFTAYAPDFPGIVAMGKSKHEVVRKVAAMIYQMALADREQYKFGLN